MVFGHKTHCESCSELRWVCQRDPSRASRMWTARRRRGSLCEAHFKSPSLFQGHLARVLCRSKRLRHRTWMRSCKRWPSSPCLQLWQACGAWLVHSQVAIEADQTAFQLYKGGVLTQECGCLDKQGCKTPKWPVSKLMVHSPVWHLALKARSWTMASCSWAMAPITAWTTGR